MSDIKNEELRNKFIENMKNTDKNTESNCTRIILFIFGVAAIDAAVLLLGGGIRAILQHCHITNKCCKVITCCDVTMISGSIALLVTGIILLKTYKRLRVYGINGL
jgi:hypothetical protein